MPAPIADVHTYDYALIRVVPRVERGEFVNVGAVLFCRTLRYIAAAVELDREKLQAIAPDLDLNLLDEHLQQIPKICAGAGPIGELNEAERFHWLVAPHSTIIQASPVHSGHCDDPEVALEHIMETMVRTG